MRERYLDVQRHGTEVRDEDKAEPDPPIGQRVNEGTEHGPVAGHRDDLCGSSPPSRSEGSGARRQQMSPAEQVQVEASDGHDGVVGVLLIRQKNLACPIPHKGEFVIGRKDAAELRGARSEKRSVLDVRVVLGCVGDEVVHVMGRFPPADTETATKVGNEYADKGIRDETLRDASMTGVMCGKHYLLPKACEEKGRCEVPLCAEACDEDAKQRRVSDTLAEVVSIVALVIALCLDALVQQAKSVGYRLLCLVIDRRIPIRTRLHLDVHRLVDIVVPRFLPDPPPEHRLILVALPLRRVTRITGRRLFKHAASDGRLEVDPVAFDTADAVA